MKQLRSLFLVLVLSACSGTLEVAETPTPTARLPLVLRSEENPYAPQPADASLQQAAVILTSLDLVERTDLNPPRTELNLLGSMPSVCSDLRVQVDPPDDGYQITIAVYSISDPKQNCDNVFQQFKANITLGQYSSGQYAVWVNGLFVGNFTSY